MKRASWVIVSVAVALAMGWFVGRYTDRRPEIGRVLAKLSRCTDASEARTLLSVIHNWLGNPIVRQQNPEITDAMVSDVVLPFLRHQNEAVAVRAVSSYHIIRDDRVCPIIRERLVVEPELMGQYPFLDALGNNGGKEDALFLIQTWKSWPDRLKKHLAMTLYGIGDKAPEECIAWFRKLSESQDTVESERRIVEEYLRASEDRWAVVKPHMEFQKQQASGSP